MMTRGKHFALMALAIASAGAGAQAAQLLAPPRPPEPAPDPEPQPSQLTLSTPPAPRAWPAHFGGLAGRPAPALPTGPNRRARRLAARQAQRGRR